MVGQWAALQRFTYVRECKGGGSGRAVGSTAALYICSAVLVSCTCHRMGAVASNGWASLLH